MSEQQLSACEARAREIFGLMDVEIIVHTVEPANPDDLIQPFRCECGAVVWVEPTAAQMTKWDEKIASRRGGGQQ